MTPDQREHFLDCLARWVDRQPRQRQVSWAQKQNQQMKDEIRRRIIKQRGKWNAGR
ncbi:uncharacterized protein YdcH (DUF465 family) [Marinobacterium sp. MBR-109]|jgi:uncharacterized protein YdcH (DUF465 family)